MKTLTTHEVRGMADLVDAYKTLQVPAGQELIASIMSQVGASLYARDYALPIAVERDALAVKVRRFEEREAHWSVVLGVTDGGQYRADWDARIRALVAERDALDVEVKRLRQAFLAKSVSLLVAEQSAVHLADHRSTCEEAARVADAEAEECRKLTRDSCGTKRALMLRARAEACELVAEKIRALPTPVSALEKKEVDGG